MERIPSYLIDPSVNSVGEYNNISPEFKLYCYFSIAYKKTRKGVFDAIIIDNGDK